MNFLIIISIMIIIFVSIAKKDENFVSYFRPIHSLPYSKKYYRSYYVPAIVLPPGYTDINYLYKNKKGIPIIPSSSYCRDKPQCYPCPNWKYVGGPICNGYSNGSKK